MARDVLDLTKQRQVHQTLASDYNIVIFMFMAVWQHIYERHGAGVAERVAVDLARRCAGTFIARTAPLALADAFTHITGRKASNLPENGEAPQQKPVNVLTIYSRVHLQLSNESAPQQYRFIVKQPSATCILDYSLRLCVDAHR